MTPQELKNSILQLAIQGKLVEQRAEEGTGRELLEKILAAKNAKDAEKGKGKGRLTRSRGDRGDAPTSTPSASPRDEISDDEKPFDIPDSWEWVRLSSLWEVLNGDRGKNYPAKSLLSKSGIPFISAINLDGETVVADDRLLCLSESQYNLLRNGKLHKGDVVVCIRGSLGKHGRYPFERGAIASSLVIMRSRFGISILDDFLMFYLDAPLFFDEIKRYDNGTAQPNLAAKSLEQFFFPLPPLAEQKRIVAKIEELMPLIDRYEKAWSRLESFNKSFPVDMQKSILQMAIQGKLVEQRAEEGTGRELLKRIRAEKAKLIAERKIKKEKPLPPITDEENPFDIPDTWEWVHLGDLANKMTDGTHRTPRYVDAGIPFVSVKDMSSGYLNLENTKFITQQEHEELCLRCNPEKGDLLISKVGTTGVPAIVDTDVQFSLFVSVALMKFSHALLNVKYLYYLIYSPLVAGQAKINTKGVGNQNWVIDKIRNTVVPLPPLAEQKRIVAKIEELLPLCERLIR